MRRISGLSVRRRQGHQHWRYQRGRRDGADAFFPDPGEGPALAPDDLAEELAEEFLTSATTGHEQGGSVYDQVVDEENGGPFVMSSKRKEFAHGFDESNIKGAEPEAFPTVGPTLDGPSPDAEEEE